MLVILQELTAITLAAWLRRYPDYEYRDQNANISIISLRASAVGDSAPNLNHRTVVFVMPVTEENTYL